MKRLENTIRNIQYVSDLHLERRNKLPNMNNISKNLILAGDIGNPYQSIYKEYLTSCSYEYENTFIVSGNHEYWNNRIDETDYQIQNITNKLGNVHFLQKNIIHANNVSIMGCTLWTNIINKFNKRVGDDLYIKDLDHNIHVDHVEWLQNTINKYKNKQIIVVTHHLPTFKLLHPKYNNKRYYHILNRFYTNLDYLIKKPIIGWVGGHSHCYMNIKLNGVQLVINVSNKSRKIDID